jgi:hypothetical protein
MAKNATQHLCLSLFFLVCVLGTFVLSGCGKKDWPSPMVKEDVFAWQTVNGQRQGKCLTIQAVLQGNIRNLAAIVLELEAGETICQGCPFVSTKRLFFPLSSHQVKQEGESISISCCPFDSDLKYRWRLKGINIFSEIQPAVSEVKTSQ